jgi:hypothetical protein
MREAGAAQFANHQFIISYLFISRIAGFVVFLGICFGCEIT